MGVFAGPRVPVKDWCLVADATNSKIITNSTTTITNVIESSNNLTGSGFVVVDDETAGRSFSFQSANVATQSNWTPVINKYNFSVIQWLKFQAGKNNNYTQTFETDTTDNPGHSYYFRCDTREQDNQRILIYVKDYDTNNWATSTVISQANWLNSTVWHQIGFTISQESEFKTYVNGKLFGTVATSSQDLSDYGNIDQIQMGSTYDTPGARCGYFAAYRRALTAAEMLANYNALKDRFGL